MLIVKYRNIFFAISALAVALSIGAVAFVGLNIGIDFTGGSLTEVSYAQERPAPQELREGLNAVGLTDYSLRPTGEQGFLLRTAPLDDAERAVLDEVLSVNGQYTMQIERFAEVGPTIGTELRNKALVAIALVIVAIILYVAFAFRKVSKPVSSWVYGSIAVLALAHDVIIPLGVFSVMGVLFGSQIDTLFVMALLAILGYSVNDTIVVFDRVRENLRDNEEKGRGEQFELTVGRSLQQAFVRSMNTSLTTLVALAALFFIGPESTQDFALTLIAGIVAGTYSSIALAPPLLVAYERWRS